MSASWLSKLSRPSVGSFAIMLMSLSGGNAQSLDVLEVEPAPVMSVGPKGSWDSRDALNPSVIRFNQQLYNYYSGFDGSVWRTGVAISTDGGATWTKGLKPILSPPYNPAEVPPYYPIAANGSSILFNGKVYHYYGQNGVDLRGEVKLATSDDGVNFTVEPQVFGPGPAGSFDQNGVADPCVVNVDGTLYMYYEGSDQNNVQLTGVATSTDGVNWTRSGSPILRQGSPADFDAAAQGEPAVVFDGRNWYMLYVGNLPNGTRSIGWAYSANGLTWTKRGPLPLKPSDLRPWFSRMMIDPTMLETGQNDGSYYVWFGGGSETGNQMIQGQIGRITIKFY